MGRVATFPMFVTLPKAPLLRGPIEGMFDWSW
jgi:hypothetical protein